MYLSQIVIHLKDGTTIIPTISTTEYAKEGQIPLLNAQNGGWVIKPLSHHKSLVSYFMVADYTSDSSIPDFMLKSRLRTFAVRLNCLNKYLDKTKYGVSFYEKNEEELPKPIS